MNNTIFQNGLPKYPQATTPNGAAAGSRPSVAAVPGTAGAGAADQVKLTNSAIALQQAARPDQADAIDHKRVDQIRQALADGSYRIDAGRIADQVLAMDHQLGGTDAP